MIKKLLTGFSILSLFCSNCVGIFAAQPEIVEPLSYVYKDMPLRGECGFDGDYDTYYAEMIYGTFEHGYRITGFRYETGMIEAPGWGESVTWTVYVKYEDSAGYMNRDFFLTGATITDTKIVRNADFCAADWNT